jgi:tRNA (guanine-N7-)-methyltransferase
MSGADALQAPTSPPRFGLFDPAESLARDYWLSLAPGTTRIEIEIGPGDGRFLLEAALAHPDTVFVGLETRAGSVARTRARQLPSNARIYHLDARFVVERLIGRGTIDAYHVYFPDPWWKKRHAKRRLVTPTFALAIARTLTSDGALYLVTDVETRFLEMRAALASAHLIEEPWERAGSDPAQSSYERKYRLQGRRIYGARYRKS